MNLPCLTCKYKTVKVEGHREFVGCKDPDRKAKNFIRDDYWYDHKCKAYEQEEPTQ